MHNDTPSFGLRNVTLFIGHLMLRAQYIDTHVPTYMTAMNRGIDSHTGNTSVFIHLHSVRMVYS